MTFLESWNAAMRLRKAAADSDPDEVLRQIRILFAELPKAYSFMDMIERQFSPAQEKQFLKAIEDKDITVVRILLLIEKRRTKDKRYDLSNLSEREIERLTNIFA